MLQKLKFNFRIPLFIYLIYAISFFYEILINYYNNKILYISIDSILNGISSSHVNLSLWNDRYSLPSLSYIFDIIYFPLIKFFQILLGNYFGLLFYLFFVSVVGSISIKIIFDKIFSNKKNESEYSWFAVIPFLTYVSILNDLLYIEIYLSYFFIPVLILLFVKSLDLYTEKKILSSVILLLFSSVILSNLLYFEPRAFIASVMLIFVFILFYQLSFVKYFFYISLIFLSGLLFIPTYLNSDVRFKTHSQLSVVGSESILVSNNLINKLFLNFNPEVTMGTGQISIMVILLSYSIYIFFIKKLKLREYVFNLILLFIIIIFTNKSLLEFLTTNLSFGQLFRHWRISQYIGGFLFFSFIYFTISKLKFNFVGKVIIVFICLLFTNYLILFGKLFYIPGEILKEYQLLNQFLTSKTTDGKVIFFPEYGWFGKNTNPYWSEKGFTAQGFPETVSQRGTYFPRYYSIYTYWYTWLASGYYDKSLILNNKDISEVLSLLGINYLVIHKDIPGYSSNTIKAIDLISQSNGLKQTYESDLFVVFENKNHNGKINSLNFDNKYICGNGFSCISGLINKEVLLKNLIYPRDSKLSKIKKIYNFDKDTSYHYFLNFAVLKSDEYRFNKYAYKNSTKIDGRYSVSCPSETHHGTLFTELQRGFEFDFSFPVELFNCFFNLNGDDFITIPIQEKGKYTILIRYLKSKDSGKVELKYGNLVNVLDTKNNLNSNQFFVINPFSYLNEGNDNLIIKNLSGKNIISSISIIPEDSYTNFLNEFKIDYEYVDNITRTNDYQNLIKDIDKVSSTEYRLNLNIPSKSFIINFSEGYNPNWTLIYLDKYLNKNEIKSINGYGLINSFIVDSNEYIKEFKIIYLPQEKFNYFFKICLGIYFFFVLFIYFLFKFLSRKL